MNKADSRLNFDLSGQRETSSIDSLSDMTGTALHSQSLTHQGLQRGLIREWILTLLGNVAVQRVLYFPLPVDTRQLIVISAATLR